MKKLARYVFLVAGFGILAVISFNPVSANTQAVQHAGAPAMDAESAAQLLPGSSQLINPQDLANVLQSAKSAKPLILNVGPYLLYAQAHIPGAEFIGPTSDSQAMDALLKRVKSLPHSKFIVLYCGCCPWDHCPN
ncbi:MAG: rhodanese-like domain-containing protein, partial [Candidatus Korobacteraceae bacterium]